MNELSFELINGTEHFTHLIALLGHLNEMVVDVISEWRTLLQIVKKSPQSDGRALSLEQSCGRRHTKRIYLRLEAHFSQWNFGSLCQLFTESQNNVFATLQWNLIGGSGLETRWIELKRPVPLTVTIIDTILFNMASISTGSPSLKQTSQTPIILCKSSSMPLLDFSSDISAPYLFKHLRNSCA